MSTKKPPFTPINDIDANAWYLISEERVDRVNKDFTMSLRLNEQGNLRVWQPAEKAQTWQFHPVNRTAGRYSLRLNIMGPYKQLAVCHDEEEADDSRTKPCMMDSVPDEEAQMWDIGDWGEGKNETVRFVNVKNGTDYWLDLHQGNPPFMASGDNINLDNYNPAQRWLYSSLSEVNDKQYSTVFSAEGVQPSKPNPTTSADTDEASPSSSNNSENDSDDSSSSLSVGATAGIGIAVALLTIALAGLAYWLIRRRQRRNGTANSFFSRMGSHSSKDGMGTSSSDTGAQKPSHSPDWENARYQQWNAQPGAQGGYAGVSSHGMQQPTRLQELSSDKPPMELESRPKATWA